MVIVVPENLSPTAWTCPIWIREFLTLVMVLLSTVFLPDNLQHFDRQISVNM